MTWSSRPCPSASDNLPYVELDPEFYKLLDDFERRFPEGPPSLREAERLVVHGDVTFGAGVRVRGAVELDADEPMTDRRRGDARALSPRPERMRS